ncbi:hypothetical protein [Streptomyces sporangiiformans]|uniref:CHAT domain-containing protein n=1 Tax=Streptomyces sporangiiformans TaxID=2315329 RepID=A0A505DN56_9ACTN|nr:hypothetical protein [Streptomyces sporangiiformans]TPQ22489.1 hypothetical protein FGD71_009525 [Streptomyces sporangiiformans]
MTLPETLRLNAWTGDRAASGGLDDQAAKWGARRQGLPHPQAPLPFQPPVDLARWDHPDVGYGILLPDSDESGLSCAAKAAGEDAPEAVRALIAARPGSVILRWRPELKDRFVRRYFPDGSSQDPTVGLSSFGVGKGRLPKYVLIVGGPDVVPWSVQYALGTRHAVGRLPLSGDELCSYVAAMLSDWSRPDATLDHRRALMWTVDHGGSDITSEMRTVISKPLADALTPPPLSALCHLSAAEATGAALLRELITTRPGLLVTSSHGRTGPLDDDAQMRATLGLPVDADHTPIPLTEFCEAMPGGAVWYAQACCSAGSDSHSHYSGLLRPGTSAHVTVLAVAALGETVAPAAVRLLGRPDPVRAVFGHVEPTFDWTLRVAETGQGLGGRIVSALSSQLYAGRPLGLAFGEYRADVGELHSQWANHYIQLAKGNTEVRESMTRLRLTALDRQSLVLLGDPTVTLPPVSFS